ncbi:MAG: alpha/beta hydrolase [Litorimonas sp.]
MESLEYLDRPNGHKIAYKKSDGTSPLIIWCGGLKSDMEGSKAVHLHAWARARGHAFIRFDYFGHGKSSGTFTDGTISQWSEDISSIMNTFSQRPVVLIGSSMGGWAALLAALDTPARIAGLVLINPAPDFTEKLTVANWTDAQIKALEDDGIVYEPSSYDEPYAYSKALIEDGRARQILDAPISLPCPVHILSGALDPVVPTAYAAKLLDVLDLNKSHVHFTKVAGADHSLSRPNDLRLIEAAISDIIDAQV